MQTLQRTMINMERLYGLSQQRVEDRDEIDQQRTELVAAIKEERLRAKRAALENDDLIDGLSSIDAMDCSVLRAAWRVSDESLGKHVRQFIERQMAASAELEAEKAADEWDES